MIVSGYLEKAFDNARLANFVRVFKQADKDKVFGTFDTIAVRGMSGMLVGPTIAFMMKKQLIIVRKGIEPGHTSRMLEGYATGTGYVIVDDFVATGNTLGVISRAIANPAAFDLTPPTCNGNTPVYVPPKLCGVFLWNVMNGGCAEERTRPYGINKAYADECLWKGVPVVEVKDEPKGKKLYFQSHVEIY